MEEERIYLKPPTHQANITARLYPACLRWGKIYYTPLVYGSTMLCNT